MEPLVGRSGLKGGRQQSLLPHPIPLVSHGFSSILGPLALLDSKFFVRAEDLTWSLSILSQKNCQCRLEKPQCRALDFPEYFPNFSPLSLRRYTSASAMPMNSVAAILALLYLASGLSGLEKREPVRLLWESELKVFSCFASNSQSHFTDWWFSVWTKRKMLCNRWNCYIRNNCRENFHLVIIRKSMGWKESECTK